MNGKNILYIPQLSMYDKSIGRYIPEADGNLNMMRNFINEWHKYNPNDYFYILLPSSVWDWSDKIITNREKIYYKSFVISARINRFNFPLKEISDNIEAYCDKIDLVINDIPELSRNIIAMFEVNFKYSPKIMSNIRHIDSITDEKMKYNYYLRLFDGIECSDFVTILSESMRDMLDQSMMEYFTLFRRMELMEKVYVFEPSVSIKELESYVIKYKHNPEKKIITFPGRLSIGEEKRTNWPAFQEAIQKLREIRQDFDVYLTDPNNSGLLDFSPNWVKTIKKDRFEFVNLLANTDIIVSLMNIQGFGGISIREALQFGCMPIIPYIDEYKNMQSDIYEGYIFGDITSKSIKDALEWALDNCDYRDKKGMSLFGKKYTIEYQMPKLLEYMEGILNG